MTSGKLYKDQAELFKNFTKTYFDSYSHKQIINRPRQAGKSAFTEEYNYRHSLQTANRAIHQDRDGELIVLKDRYYGKHTNKKLSNDEMVELISSMIVEHLFSDNMRIFEDTKKKELSEAIKKTIEKEMQL